MLKINEINTSHIDYPMVEDLLHSAFPECERRDDQAQRYNTDNIDIFHTCVIYDHKIPIGLLTYWDFENFCYIEHFAINPSKRGQSYGSKALTVFFKMVNKPVVLEVECPTDEISRRRIEFYRRQGLNLWDSNKYLQPPYRRGDQPVPMLMMASPDLDNQHFYYVKGQIYRNVYNVAE